MTLGLKRTGDPDYPKHIKALVMGPPKSGKTSWISTFPNIVVADVEAGLMSIAHKNVPYVEIDSLNTLNSLLMVLSNDRLRQGAAEKLELDKIESVAIDTLDALQELMKRERLAKERRTQFQREDWGWLLEQMTGVIRGFIDLPLHVVFSVHTTTTLDDENRMIYAPGLQGAIQERIAGMVGFSLFAERTVEMDPKGNPYTDYKLVTEGDKKNPHLGNRAAGRLPRIIDPDFKVLYDAVYAGLQLAQGSQVQVESAGSNVETPESPDSGEEVAQSTGQPEGVPEKDDSEFPVTAAGISHLQTAYRELGLALPPNINEWTLGKARMVSQWIVACKDDKIRNSLDQETFMSRLLEGLRGMEAVDESSPQDATVEEIIDRTIDAINAWVGDDLDRARQAYDAERAKGEGNWRITLLNSLASKLGISQQEVSKPKIDEVDPAFDHPFERLGDPDEERKASEDDLFAKAEEVLTNDLGATPVETAAADDEDEQQQQVSKMPFDDEDFVCEACGNPCDDPDIAKLSRSMYGKVLCVSDYMEHKKAKA